MARIHLAIGGCSLALIAGSVLGSAARAQGTMTVSREYTIYVQATQSPMPATLTISRELSVFAVATQNPPPATLAISRDLSVFLSYGFGEVVKALQIAAGLQKPEGADMQFLNVVSTGASADAIDLLDAVRLAYLVSRPGTP